MNYQQLNIKFYLVPADYPTSAYHHEMVVIAEGLRELGVNYYGTLNYWKEPDTNKYLIEQAPDSFENEINIYSVYYFNLHPDAIHKVDYSKINIIIDKEDGYYSLFADLRFKKFDLVLKTHYNKNIPYHYYQNNIKPWAFGLSNRIMQSIDASLKTTVENKVYVNFRVNQSLREMAYERFTPVISRKYPVDLSATLPAITGRPFKSNLIIEKGNQVLSEADKLYQLQTGYRHDTNYYRKLNSSLLTYAFGGFIYSKPFLTNRFLYPVQYFYKLIHYIYQMMNADVSPFVFINQFDSWRWWEALYANTCPIHMDFDDWGWILPVMPENKVHYWGVKKLDFERSAIELLKLHREDILQIGLNGRNWAKEHYSPIATAQRLLGLINEIKGKRC